MPDQLKSAVVSARWHEPGIQRTYAGMAAHYGTAIVGATDRQLQAHFWASQPWAQHIRKVGALHVVFMHRLIAACHGADPSAHGPQLAQYCFAIAAQSAVEAPEPDDPAAPELDDPAAEEDDDPAAPELDDPAAEEPAAPEEPTGEGVGASSPEQPARRSRRRARRSGADMRCGASLAFHARLSRRRPRRSRRSCR